MKKRFREKNSSQDNAGRQLNNKTAGARIKVGVGIMRKQDIGK
ncbi:MAG: hypothetical protein UU13_C0024G0002 [Candidatus Nomurabacteria bacterium GW2011_GWB1_40_7]|uniref:Uncharacterized protein n=1 Tax=Candidatus Nomurabacteria bacterium GW2011_GWB1_40_7 TaxID=1618744 RepID=A0A0G0SY28_9BACT|nr:MAG: hypothetical protein UU13_C0024G0002 [Candidatus Nomurabacteria bacterium GW2011_GWB1_40_7]